MNDRLSKLDLTSVFFSSLGGALGKEINVQALVGSGSGVF